MYSRNLNMSGGILSKDLQAFVRENIIKPTLMTAAISKLAPQQVTYAATPAAASVGTQVQPVVIQVPESGISTGTAVTTPQYTPLAASAEMDVFKKYLPYIIGGAALLLLMSKK